MFCNKIAYMLGVLPFAEDPDLSMTAGCATSATLTSSGVQHLVSLYSSWIPANLSLILVRAFGHGFSEFCLTISKNLPLSQTDGEYFVPSTFSGEHSPNRCLVCWIFWPIYLKFCRIAANTLHHWKTMIGSVLQRKCSFQANGNEAYEVQSGQCSRAKHGDAYFSAVCGSIQDLFAVPEPYENQEF